MTENFDKAFDMLMKHEGGYVNHKRDPGGRTNMGITQRVYERWIGRQVEEAEMKALTPEIVKPIYKSEYWNVIKGDALPSGLDYCVFDAAVNSGCGQSAKWLQRAVGAFDDGAIGKMTLLRVSNKPVVDTIKEMSQLRMSFLQKLPTWDAFGRGWARRVKEVEDASIALVSAR